MEKKSPPKKRKKKLTHGGARAGSGRQKRDTIAVTVRLPPEILSYLNLSCGRKGRSRNIASMLRGEMGREMMWLTQENVDARPGFRAWMDRYRPGWRGYTRAS